MEANQTAEEPQAFRFTWTIKHFTRLNLKKLYSDIFVVGGYEWRVLIFPKGNNVDFLSMYLEVADAAASLPYGWSRYAQFSLGVVNRIHSKFTLRKDTQHQFNQRESDWGFTSFMPLGEFYDPGRGYLVNDTVIIEADIDVRKVLDSDKETIPSASAGLKNPEASTNSQPARMSQADMIQAMYERQIQTHDRVLDMENELRQQGDTLRRLSEHLGMAPPPPPRVGPLLDVHVPNPIKEEKELQGRP